MWLVIDDHCVCVLCVCVREERIFVFCVRGTGGTRVYVCAGHNIFIFGSYSKISEFLEMHLWNYRFRKENENIKEKLINNFLFIYVYGVVVKV